jgi:hypothetical protein
MILKNKNNLVSRKRLRRRGKDFIGTFYGVLILCFESET